MAASFCVLLLATLSYPQSEAQDVRVSSHDCLGALARANSLAELQSKWQQCPKDYPHRAVHAAIYMKLGGLHPDTVLLGAMPENGEQMEALYNAQETKQGQDMAVTDAYNAYYTHLADALERHPGKLSLFLKMIHAFNVVDNVDEWPWLCGLASKIYDAHPDAYMSAVNKLRGEFRQEGIDCKEPPDAP